MISGVSEQQPTRGASAFLPSLSRSFVWLPCFSADPSARSRWHRVGSPQSWPQQMGCAGTARQAGPRRRRALRHSRCIRHPCRSAGAPDATLSEPEPTWLETPAVSLACEALLSRSSGHEPGDVAASVRLRAASFRSIDFTCTLTVASAISRCRAICLLDSPRFTSVRTDASRGDKPRIRVSHWFDSEGRGCSSRTPRPNAPLGTIVMSSAARDIILTNSLDAIELGAMTGTG